MTFNQKRGSISTSTSFASSGPNPRRQSSYGHIMAGTGGLPSAHTAAIKSSIAAAQAAASSSNNNSSSNNSITNGNPNSSSKHGHPGKRLSNLHLLNPPQSQHRNQSLKARVARVCPSLIHGPGRRKRNTFVLLCAGGIVVLIYFMSTWNITLSSTIMDRSSLQHNQPHQQQQQQHQQQGAAPAVPTEYLNPDGTKMDSRSIFMLRDFGRSACKKAFDNAYLKQSLPEDIRFERERARTQQWDSITKEDAWSMSLTWKREYKRTLPNWKDYSYAWIGQGVVLGAFRDADGKDTVANILVQIKLIRSLSSIPIEVWFERVEDITEETQEAIATWGGVVRTLDQVGSIAMDAVVQISDPEAAALGSLHQAIPPSAIQEFKQTKAGQDSGRLQKALTLAALINSGFEDIFFLSPSTLPMQSPRVIFQRDDYLRSGAIFWQHPSSFPAHDSPMWSIIQADCNPTMYEQSWSAFALRHKDSWKGLFLAWHWLTGADSDRYERLIGSQGNDLMRLAWMALNKQYTNVDRMPQVGLLDLSRSKGDGIACNQGATLYPAPGATVLENPKQYATDQRQLQKLFQKSYRYGGHEELFVANHNVMMVDTSVDSGLIHSGSNDRHFHVALDTALMDQKDPTRLLLTDVYAAGSDRRTCLKIARRVKGYHQHE
ncbi:hypothetical protein BGZ95_011938 [Linnemannia exigua]|uniref:Uncharacterized protein n=1 Tax=Linnemannia exigua TaxID=604196 RepID=A0AAD4HB50_9FUNG|nr:hypothetical protein BGZ95_011938 [Linnemannia exigua]